MKYLSTGMVTHANARTGCVQHAIGHLGRRDLVPHHHYILYNDMDNKVGLPHCCLCKIAKMGNKYLVFQSPDNVFYAKKSLNQLVTSFSIVNKPEKSS